MALLSRTLATLPFEIISLICEFLGCASLKQCRLVNHSIETQASEALFSTVHITTTITSLEHAKSIGRSAKHNTKVKAVIYHASSVISGPHGSLDESTDMSEFRRNGNIVEFINMIDFLRHAVLGMDTLIPRNMEMKELWRDYEAIWRARRDLESHGYVSQRLRTLTQQFPNIVTIRLAPMSMVIPYRPGEHFPILSRVDEDAFTDVLGARYDREIKCLSANHLHWGSFRLCNDMTVLCSGLRELDLVIEDNQIGFPYSTMQDDFATFLGLCRNLEVLKLKIGTCEPLQDSRSNHIAAACSLLLKINWSRLEKVKLENLITTERDIEGFLRNNARTLRLIKFERLHMPSMKKRVPGGALNTVKYLSATLRRCQNAVILNGECWEEHQNWRDVEGEPLIGWTPFHFVS